VTSEKIQNAEGGDTGVSGAGDRRIDSRACNKDTEIDKIAGVEDLARRCWDNRDRLARL